MIVEFVNVELRRKVWNVILILYPPSLIIVKEPTLTTAFFILLMYKYSTQNSAWHNVDFK